MRSRILDRGTETLLVYPEVRVTDSRGNSLLQPAETPVTLRVTTAEERQSDAELPGQVSIKVVRVLTRSAPVGSWARVVYNGEEWDLAGPPRFVQGLSKATRHVEFQLRSRNQAGIPR
jgi:hypothetical protein